MGKEVLNTLVAHHENVGEALDAMYRLVGEPVPRHDEVARERLRLSKASTARTQFLNASLYPALAALKELHATRHMQALQNDDGENRARSSAHIGKWNNASIRADWNGYRQDATRLLVLMKARLDEERRILYPLLNR